MATRNQKPLDADRIRGLKQKRRAKKKARKRRQQQQSSLVAATDNANTASSRGSGPDTINSNNGADVYYPDDAVHTTLENAISPIDCDSAAAVNEAPLPPAAYAQQQQEQQQQQPSRKKLKKLTQLTLEELKEIADVPEVVEPWDMTAADPALLISLKGYRNTVSVPRHWYKKQSYLHHRKDRPTWQLPDYIAQTGIADTRDAMRKKEARASARRRARLNPKLGKMDIDYQKLHDAFFKHPMSIRLSRHGELYYEGKEWNNHYQPGILSDTLRKALGMDDSKDSPPPWLYTMQRHGPPPGHSNLKLPGVNMPVPNGAPLGYKRGGWGAPPPLLPMVHGRDDEVKEPIDKGLWGELLDEENELGREEQTSDQDEEEEDEDEAERKKGVEDEPITEFDVPETLELRKARPATSSSQDTSLMSKPQPLYHVLSPLMAVESSGFLPSEHTYNIIATKDVDVAVHDPSELEDASLLMSKYEDAQDAKPSSKQQQQQQQQQQHEEVSDMYLKHAQLQARRRKQQDRLKQSKKKDFRF